MEPTKSEEQLILLFDSQQIDISELSRYLGSGLGENIRHKIGLSVGGYWELTLIGPLVEIDSAHSHLMRVFQDKNWGVFRLKDTAGDEIRQQAYSQLSEIEQDLRAFINHGLTNVFGFAWWNSLGSIEIPGIQDPTYRKSHHPLELMTIEQLIELVTLEKSEWSEDTNIKIKDLAAILDASSSFEEFKTAISGKSRKVSLWSLVFEKYLGKNASTWLAIKEKDLKSIIDLRNKVMHHRPVYRGELIALEDKRKRLMELLASATVQLSDEERNDVITHEKEIRDIFAQIVYERSSQNAYYQLYSSLQESRNDVIIRNLKKEADLFVKTGMLSAKESLELQAVSFERLEALTNHNLIQTEPIIIGELLPLCFLDDPELRYQYGSLRDVLVKWIENHAQGDTKTLIDLVLDQTLISIGTEKHLPACWIIANLGYSREDLVKRLLEFAVSSDNENGDGALSCLTWLGISDVDRSATLQELHSRAQRRYSNTIAWSLARLGDAASVHVIVEEWLSKENVNQKGVDTAIAFSAIREISEANEDDEKIQDEIWRAASQVVEKDLPNTYLAFDIGHLIKTCNSNLVIPTILKWHGESLKDIPNAGWWRYLVQERLEEAVKPQQLQGWKSTSDFAIINLLQQDACKNSDNDTFFQNELGMEKKAAWQMVLRAENANALNWFEPAVAGEGGRFLRKEIMNDLSDFKINPIPEAAIRWVTEEFDDKSDGDGRELSYRMAAVQLIKSLASEEAFAVLLNFGYTRDGNIMQSSVDAVADVAIALLRNGNYSVIKTLFNAALQMDLRRKRIAAAFALSTISEIDEYVSKLVEYRDSFISMAQDENREPWEREYLLYILGNLLEEIPEDLEEKLVSFAQGSDEHLRKASLIVLAYLERLEAYPDLLSDILKINQEGERWVVKVEGLSYDWAPYIIGILYFRKPNKYVHVVVALIESLDGRLFSQIIPWLYKSKKTGKISDEIFHSLQKRLVTHNSSYRCETESFIMLEALYPYALIHPDLIRETAEWMPDAKVALANSIRRVNWADEQKGNCLTLLEYLTEDENYSVRRAAYRSVASISQDYLYKLFSSYSESPILILNLRASEAYGWISNITDENGNDVCKLLKTKFALNIDRRIRETAKRSWKERKHREWTKDYLEKVLSIDGKDNQQILQAWKYGDALTRTGDDETLEALSKYLQSEPLLPNMEFLLYDQIYKPLEQNWKKVTNKWPQPWFDSHGLLQRGKGKVIIDSKGAIDVEYSLWFNPASAPSEKASWGGTLMTNLWQLMVSRNHDVVLELENSQKGRIVFTSTASNTTTFAGNGSFPG
jgi:hypothetical protein